MSCSGLHCAGCAGGMAVPVVPLVTFCGLAWVAEHLVEVAVTSAVCGVLAVAAVVAIMRWQDRRQARFAAQASIWTAREIRLPQPDLPSGNPVSGFTESRTGVRDSALLGIGPAELHLHFHGQPGSGQEAAVRRMLGISSGHPLPDESGRQ